MDDGGKGASRVKRRLEKRYRGKKERINEEKRENGPNSPIRKTRGDPQGLWGDGVGSTCKSEGSFHRFTKIQTECAFFNGKIDVLRNDRNNDNVERS